MKKIFSSIFILIVLVGLFPFASKAEAAGTCWYRGAIQGSAIPGYKPVTDPANCLGTWQAQGAPIPAPPNGPPAGTTVTPGTVVVDPCASVGTGTAGDPAYDACKETEAQNGRQVAVRPGNNNLKDIVDNEFTCNPFGDGNMFPGCLVVLVYYIFYTLASWLLAIAAVFFNVLAYITLQSTYYTSSDFISRAWTVTRDVSNIFFILVLLYAAFQTILGIGHGAQKTIAHVVVMALLINFSMFATKVVIDSSNILALVFYNKLEVNNQQAGGELNLVQRGAVKIFEEKDLGKALVNKFQPGELLKPEFFTSIRQQLGGSPTAPMPTGIMLGLIIVYGAITGVAAYAFFVAALSFVGRLVQLWMLIIFSPFAFMSFTIPELKKLDKFGWDYWTHKLVSTAFMAPVFMFFMYFIFLFMNASGATQFETSGNTNFWGTLMTVLIPAAIMLTLLLAATSYAKKGAGTLGEMAVKWGTKAAQLAGGAAVGVATGGAAFLAQQGVGRIASNAAESNRLRGWAARSKIGSGVLQSATYLGSKSYDIRASKLGGKAFSSAGLKVNTLVGKPQEGGFTKSRLDKVKREEKFANEMLDTTDKGKAEIVKGYRSRRETDVDFNELVMDTMRRKNVSEEGAMLSIAKEEALARNANRREAYANRIQKSRFISKQMVANKIRKGAAQLKEEGDIAHAFHSIGEAMGHAGGAAHATPAPAAAPHAAPAAAAPAAAGPAPADHGPTH